MRVLLVGCGNIGGSLLETCLSSFPGLEEVFVVQPSLSYVEKGEVHSAKFFSSLDQVPKSFDPDFTMLCIKPQDLAGVLPGLRGKILVSFLAGVKISAFPFSKVVRVMPNLGLKYGTSANLAVQSRLTSKEVKQLEELLACSGTMFWLENEAMLDSLTSISGSGPGYFFLLADVLLKEVLKLGINETTGRELVKLVFSASAARVASNENYKNLIDRVSSKGGVTEAAMEVMKPGMERVVREALQRATIKIKELSCETSN